MNPFDVISTRLYQSAGRRRGTPAWWTARCSTAATEGLLALQRGWTGAVRTPGPPHLLTFMALEQVRPLFAAVDAFVTPDTRGGAPATAAAFCCTGSRARGSQTHHSRCRASRSSSFAQQDRRSAWQQ
jgi:hypothetical protein